jgi:hypothetical protein
MIACLNNFFKVKVGEADHYIKLHVTHNRELGLQHNSLEQAHVQEIVERFGSEDSHVVDQVFLILTFD